MLYDVCVLLVVMIVASSCWSALWNYKQQTQTQQNDKQQQQEEEEQPDQTAQFPQDLCALRTYAPDGYYDWTNPSNAPADADEYYLFGQWPRVLSPTAPAEKMCLERYHSVETTTIPFMDGIRPSILSAQRLQHVKDFNKVMDWYSSNNHNLVAFVGLAGVTTETQCHWQPDDGSSSSSSSFKPIAPSITNQTVLVLLDGGMQRIARMTIPMDPNVPWGDIPVGDLQDNCSDDQDDDDECHSIRYHKAVWPDYQEARLLIHQDRLWISYRNQENFGPDTLLFNPIHFGALGLPDNYYYVHIKASETMINGQVGHDDDLSWIHSPRLSKDTSDLGEEEEKISVAFAALSSVDPMTLVSIPAVPLGTGDFSRNTPQSDPRSQQQPLILGSTSNLVHLADQNEYLGVGYIDRPADPTASFNGRPRTHFFFTISDQPPYTLTGLTPELFLSAAELTYEDGVEAWNFAERIQFWSGLEVVFSDTFPAGGALVAIAYAINDCESVVTSLPWSKIEKRLQPVYPFGNGTARQVSDLLSPL